MPLTPASQSTTHLLAWQGWRVALPRSWNPVKIEGDYSRGSILLADLDHPRLGVRWQLIKQKRLDAGAWIQRTMQQEVGALDSAKARPRASALGPTALFYQDPAPPGRNVFIAYSPATNRAIQIVHHAKRRDNLLSDVIIPSLLDTPQKDPTPWSIFDLTCQSPPGFRLVTHRLMAGDLALTFSNKRQRLCIRQISVAKLALARRPLIDWLNSELQSLRPHYQPCGNLREVELHLDGSVLPAFVRDTQKLKRFALHRSLPSSLATAALHDPDSDRLLLLRGSDLPLIEQLLESL